MCVCTLCVSLQFSDSLLCFIEEEDSEEGGEQDVMQVLGNMVMALLVKYWIYICGGMFFFVSFEGTIVMYKIIYMMMFLSCVALYQVSKQCSQLFFSYFHCLFRIFSHVLQDKTATVLSDILNAYFAALTLNANTQHDSRTADVSSWC